MPSIFPQTSDCCDPCCQVNVVDLPAQGAILGCCNHYDTLIAFRNEGQIAVLVDQTPATLYGSVTRGDGLGGFYYFDSNAIDADDGVSIIRPNSILVGNPGRWRKWLG